MTRVAVDVLHHDLIAEHGGLPGVRDDNLLESTLARPVNQWQYEPATDLAGLAALYGHGLTKGHPYVDGNKRIGFVAMGAFLDLNGQRLEARNEEIVDVMRHVAAGVIAVDDLAAWVRDHVVGSGSAVLPSGS